jgi:rRNA maturation protein Nop10
MKEKCVECDGDGWVADPADGGRMVCPVCGGEEYDERDDDSEA